MAPPRRGASGHALAAILQLPRLLVAVVLVQLVVQVADGMLAPAQQAVSISRAAHVALIGLWVAGSVLLVVELVLLGVRDAKQLPWPGSSPLTAFIAIRAAFACCILFLCADQSEPEPAWICLAMGVAVAVFGWRVPAALRGLRALRRVERSLRTSDRLAPLGSLREQVGDLGRRLLTGTITWEPDGAFSMAHGGVIARCTESGAVITHGVQLARTVVVLTGVHVEGAGYRSGGARLYAAGLPIWVLPSDAERARLHRLVRSAAALDAALVGAAALLLTLLAGVVCSAAHG